ncbi:MAG: hypothetical protein WC683_15000 [bacterium]
MISEVGVLWLVLAIILALLALGPVITFFKSWKAVLDAAEVHHQ